MSKRSSNERSFLVSTQNGKIILQVLQIFNDSGILREHIHIETMMTPGLYGSIVDVTSYILRIVTTMFFIFCE